MNPWFPIRDWLLAQLQYPELHGVTLDSPEMTPRRRKLLERNACRIGQVHRGCRLGH